jgi:hypothetical protein
MKRRTFLQAAAVVPVVALVPLVSTALAKPAPPPQDFHHIEITRTGVYSVSVTFRNVPDFGIGQVLLNGMVLASCWVYGHDTMTLNSTFIGTPGQRLHFEVPEGAAVAFHLQRVGEWV